MLINIFVLKITCIILKLSLLLSILSPTCPASSLYQLKDLNIDKYYLSSTKLKTKPARNDDTEDSSPEYWFNIMSDDNIYHAVIRKRNSDLILPNKSSLTIYLDRNTSHTEKIEIAQLYEGYIMEKPKNSSLDGYVTDGSFCGHVLIDYDFYYIGDGRDVTNYVAIDSLDDLNKELGGKHKFGFPSNQFYDRRQSVGSDVKEAYVRWKQKGMLCSLVVVIDNSFLRVLHGGNRAAAIYQSLLSLEEANAIFRTTDFDDDNQPDNIGFYVKNLVVIDTEDAPYFMVNYRRDPRSINNVFFRFTTQVTLYFSRDIYL
ncbi:hypothetical protein GWI33_012623 [Rhynchophorus ferrugineus]|uniref:Uncharacterized protein n=1 Tax=Rhynchophorus ferrugineus TaxID=354439 RepID=A0A834I651_RHYFE|nr:hypothetical protein GWI33_012623 [Rhynchophorus ferrugineus]